MLRAWKTWCGVALLVACTSVAHAGIPDTWVTAKVKMALLTSPGVGGPINVDTDDGRVTLHGEVAKADQKREAERVASEVTGVHGVRNLLQIIPPEQKKEIRIHDAALEKRVKAVLEDVPSLRDVKVKSVHHGLVLLGGKTERMSDHLDALELVANVEGVRQVATDVQTPDVSNERRLGSGEETLAVATRGPRADAWITMRAKLRLMSDSEIQGRDIHVDTRAGHVVLFGSVPSEALREKAGTVVAEISGVGDVRNHLAVVPETSGPDVAETPPTAR
jgi:osmotically-inducible protein OsmY